MLDLRMPEVAERQPMGIELDDHVGPTPIVPIRYVDGQSRDRGEEHGRRNERGQEQEVRSSRTLQQTGALTADSKLPR